MEWLGMLAAAAGLFGSYVIGYWCGYNAAYKAMGFGGKIRRES